MILRFMCIKVEIYLKGITYQSEDLIPENQTQKKSVEKCSNRKLNK